jgi:hypothetical protein
MNGNELLLLILLLPYIIMVVIRLVCTYFVYTDTRAKQIDPIIWIVTVIALGLIGFIIYILVRESHYKKQRMAQLTRPGGYANPAHDAGPPVGQPGALVGPVQTPPSTAPVSPETGSTGNILCKNCGNLISNPPFGNVVYCENCGHQTKIN